MKTETNSKISLVISYKFAIGSHIRLGDISKLIALWAIYIFFLPEISLDKTAHKALFRRLRVLFFPVLLLMIFISGIIGGAHWTGMIAITSTAFAALLPFLFNIRKWRWVFRGCFFLLAVLVFCCALIILPYKTTTQRLKEGDLSIRRMRNIGVLQDWDTMSSDLEILNGSKNITEFHFENVKVVDGNFDLLASLDYLKRLYIVDSQITGGDLAKLANLQHFELLYLDNIVVNDEFFDSITALHHLKELTIGNTKIQPDVLVKISKNQNINTLSLVNIGDISNEIIEEIKARRTNMDLYFEANKKH
ncbi:MAG: hypothetical protein ACYTER_10045 [Planctomycetota bacterium]|jgi:hypothetical protein